MRFLERQGKVTQQNRKTKQHNTTRQKQLFFKEKLAALGNHVSHVHICMRLQCSERKELGIVSLQSGCTCLMLYTNFEFT